MSLKRFYISILTALVTIACSTEHNTWYSRHYQMLTSEFNVFFNGKEAFDNGINTVREKYNNDYSNILPVYEFSDKQTAQAASSDMETALKKSHKLIQLHSIKTKPATKENETEKDKRFRAQEEFNPLVDDAYLLIGKANVVLHEEEEAIEIFDYIARKFPTDPSAYEGKIWKSIAYIQMGQPANAQTALESYDLDGLAPVSLYGQFMAAYANMLISTSKYAEAIPYMQKAVENADCKHNRYRYKYILAQLYRTTGHNDQAAPLFLELSKIMSNYDMAFAAKLDLATVASTPEELAVAEKKLSKMARDPKNTEQLDQIYYAIGKMNENRGQKQMALYNYQRSIEASVSNDNQKGLSFLAKADIYINQPTQPDNVVSKYLNASNAIDSASTFLDKQNARKEEAINRSNDLSPLATSLRTIYEQDSLMRIANMDAKSRDAFIDDMLRKIEEAEKTKQEAAEAEEEQGMSQSDFFNVTRNSGRMPGRMDNGSQWYFYNTTMVNAGKSQFINKWGRRKNEDNWRRTDKSSASFSQESARDELGISNPSPEENSAENSSDDLRNVAEGSPNTREGLLANLPLTEKQKNEANEKIDEALFDSGIFLYDNTKDYVASISLLQQLLNRNPKHDCNNCYDALVVLYFAQVKNNQTSDAKATANIIRTEYPETLFAKYLSESDFFGQQDLAKAESEARYLHTYDAYLKGNYSEAISSASTHLPFSEPSEYEPKYLLVRALSYAKTGQSSAFKADLIDITTKYNDTEESAYAEELLALLEEGKNPVKETPYESPLQEIEELSENEQKLSADFTFLPDTTHTIICLIDEDKANEAQYTVADYNFTNYLLEDLDIRMSALSDKRKVLLVSGFTNMTEAMNYYYALRDKRFWKELTSSSVPDIYVSSDNNIKLILLSSISQEFQQFFNENYLNK